MKMRGVITLLRRYWPILVFILIYLFIFRKVFISKLVPFPGDLLTSWFFPYRAGGWEGYSSWITHKEFILADVIRQLYPWRILSIDLLRQGILPLWNIYSFSGNPLLANLQSAVLYPLNILFIFTKTQWAWIVYIMVQPILATLFMYMFIRSLGLSRLASIFAGIGFAFIGYTMVWFETGIIGHTALWLPFILWGMTKFIDTKKTMFLIFSAIGIASSILAGHAQTTAYVLLFAVTYFVYMGWGKLSKRQFMIGLIFLSLGITLAAIQIIPSLELMGLSPRDAISSTRTFHKFITPSSHIAMLFAPDFFGNPATGNFWGKDYGEFMSYSGVVVLLIATIGFYSQFKNKIVRLSLVTTIISFLIAFIPPIAELLFRSQIPILSTGLPSRTIFLASVGFTIASAYGVEAIQKIKLKKIIPPMIIVVIIYILLWIILFTINLDPSKLSVTKRNLILPTGIVLLVSLTILGRRFTKRAFILWIVVFACMGLEYSYFLNKYLPWSPVQYMFPSHELVQKLSEISGVDRIYGYDTAEIGTNLNVQWRILSPEGYDPLYIRRYSELMRAGTTGKLETDLQRADALLPHSLPSKDPYTKQVLLNLLGVRYVLDKDDNVPKNWDPRTDHFPTKRFQLIYQHFKWKIYKNKVALPRAAVFYDYIVIPQKDKSIKTLFDRKFSYGRRMILETTPTFSPQSLPITPAKISIYSSNSVKIDTDTKQSGLLFLSDNYYPGWRAFMDNKPVPILRADYTFRAIELPKGRHEVRFEYKPNSFYIGALISLVSVIILGFFYNLFQQLILDNQ